jgi:signal transduction histidine kinase
MRWIGALVTWLDATGVPGHWAKRYGIAVLTVVVALAIDLTLSRVAAYSPLVVFAASVAVAARYGGRGPALLASLLAVLVIEILFFQSAAERGQAVSSPWLRLIVFVIVALTISSMSSALHAARRTAELQAQKLKEMNGELERQMEEVQTLSEQLQETNDALVTERDRAEALAKRAQAAAQAREDVLGVVAHDLRNPLNVLSMTTQLFLDIEPSPDHRLKMLHAMQRAARQMNRLTTDLLEVVRLE